MLISYGRAAEGYPVYSVHQYAMAPMDLSDLAEAGGGGIDAICKGLRSIERPPETGDEYDPRTAAGSLAEGCSERSRMVALITEGLNNRV